MENRRRKLSLRGQWPWVILLLIIVATFLPLPYYTTSPGDAKVLDPIVHVEDGDQSKGVFMLTTVLVGKANVAEYIWAKASDYREIFPDDQIKGKDETDEEYEARQLQLMQGSQDAAKIVAYKAAGKKIDILHKGVLVTGVISGMSAADKLKVGDVIVEMEGKPIDTAEQLIEGLKDYGEGDNVTLTVKRADGNKEVELTLQPFPEKLFESGGGGEKYGIGITYPVTLTEVKTDPEVTIDTNQIGGPSAGFMFTLEIYDQLNEKDWTKGYRIAGTGTMNIKGEIGPIGGIKQKVVAADNANAEIFFAPVAASNYDDAKEAAKDINTEMEVVPVKNFQDALDYLEKLKSKSS